MGKRYFIQDYTLSAIADKIREQGKMEGIPIRVTDMPKYIENATAPMGLIDGTITSITNQSPTIRPYCFFSCTNLSYVSFPNCSFVGKSAFRGTNLKEVYLPNCTSYGQSAFNGCSKIEKLTIGLPYLSTTTSTEDFYTILSGNTNLKEVYLPNCSIIYSSVFQGCTGLTSICAPSLGKITQHAFDGCTSLSEFYMPASGWADPQVGANAFVGCTGLKKVSLPYAVSLNYYAFSSCPALEEFYAPNLTTASSLPFGAVGVSTSGGNLAFKSVTIGYGTVPNFFKNQPNLVYFSDSNATSIATGAFSNCTSLSEGGWYFGSKGLVQINNQAFQNCTAIHEIKNEHFIGASTCLVGRLTFGGCTNLERVDTEVFTTIYSNTFSGCTALSEVNLPNVSSIIYPSSDITSTMGPFYGCTALETLSMAALKIVPSSCFYANTAFKDVYLDTCTNLYQQCFRGCTNLSTLYIPKCTAVEQYAFYGCANLTKISGPAITTFGHYNLQGGNGTKEVYLPVCSYVGKYGFSNTVLESIYAPAWSSYHASGVFNTSSYKTTLKYANVGFTAIPAWFSACTNLRSFIAEKCTALVSNQFAEDVSLYTVSLPKCATIASSAFKGCTALPSIDLPVATKISASAFLNCTNFSQITLRKEALCALANSNAFTGTAITATTGSILVPTAWVASYKAATNWSLFADRIFGF